MIETSGLRQFKAYDFFRKCADVPPNILKAVTPLQKGNFVGADATMFLKDGALDKIKNLVVDLPQKCLMVLRTNLMYIWISFMRI